MSETSGWLPRSVWALLPALPLAALVSHCRLVVIEGGSMLPTLGPGDRILVVPALWLRLGDIVAVPDPRHSDRLLVKRVTAIDHPGRLIWVIGDNAVASTDSREFGPVRRSAIVGRVIYCYFPPARAGSLTRRRVSRTRTSSGRSLR